MLNALRSAVRRSRIDATEARQALAILQAIPKEVVAADTQGQTGILETALKRDLSAYDATYFHLAESRGVRLVSADKDLLRLQRQFPWIKTVDQILRETDREAADGQ
jgi:predicted nucleic acid-binding protein